MFIVSSLFCAVQLFFSNDILSNGRVYWTKWYPIEQLLNCFQPNSFSIFFRPTVPQLFFVQAKFLIEPPSIVCLPLSCPPMCC